MALVLVLPLVDRMMGHAGAAFWLMVSLSVMVCCWTPLFNAIFDKFFEAPSTDSKRNWKLRTFHAFMLEFSVVSITTPVVSWWTELSFEKAVYLNLQISVVYIVYAYFFFLFWDKAVARIELRNIRRQS